MIEKLLNKNLLDLMQMGGAKSDTNYNKIEQPGKRYRNEDDEF